MERTSAGMPDLKAHWPSSETVQVVRLPAKTKPNAVVVAEPVIVQLISGQANFPTMLQEPDSPTYEVRQCATEQMGLGMFATRNLKPGELILSERPALVYPGRFRSSTDELENLFSVALDEISVDEDRVAYRKLSKGLNKTPRVGDLVRIATANCFQLPPNPPGGPNERWTIGDYRAVYLISSRINHSCSPNTVADFDLLSFSMVVRAARDIKQGEEISTAYIALHSPKAHRKTLLAFCMDSCGCPVCMSPPDGSDPRRIAMTTYGSWPLVNHLAQSVPVEQKLTDMLQCVRNVEEEGLQSTIQYPLLLDISGRLAGLVGNQALAATQQRNAKMFYQMRSWYITDSNFVKWVFEAEEGMMERVRWAVSHFEEFQQLVNRGFLYTSDLSDLD